MASVDPVHPVQSCLFTKALEITILMIVQLRVFATKRFGVIIGDVINVLKLATVADYLTDGEIGNEQVLVKNNINIDNYKYIDLSIPQQIITREKKL